MFGKSASICPASSSSSSTLVWSRDCCTISWVVSTLFQKFSTDPISDSGHTNNGGCIRVVSDMFPFTKPKMSRRSPWPRRRLGTRSSVSIPAPLWGIAGRARGFEEWKVWQRDEKTSQSKVVWVWNEFQTRTYIIAWKHQCLLEGRRRMTAALSCSFLHHSFEIDSNSTI